MASLKTINRYRKYYPFEAPHKVILDTRFIEFMIRCKKTAKDISDLLGNEAKLFTTRCVKRAIQIVPSILEQVSTQRFLYSIPDLKCAHISDDCMASEDCIACMFENGNRECYFVATTNETLKTMLAKMRNVPVISLHKGNIVLMTPVTDSQAVHLVESSWDKPVNESNIEKMPNKVESLKKLLTCDDEPSTKKEKKPLRTKTLFVSNLLFSINEEDVVTFFKDAGKIVKAYFAIKDEKFAGNALLDFATHDAAQKALDLNGQVLRGRTVRISVANDKVACRARKGDSGGAVRWVDSAVFEEKAQNMKRDKEARKSLPLIDGNKSKLEIREAGDAVKRESFNVEGWLMSKKRNPESYMNDDKERSMSKRKKLEKAAQESDKAEMKCVNAKRADDTKTESKLEKAAHKKKRDMKSTCLLKH